MLVFSPSSNSFPIAESHFQQEVFDFCRSWNAGQHTFSFQTSGSTGTPKKILIDREKMIYSAQLTSNWLKLEPNDVALLCLPVQYIAGAMTLVRALVLDLQIILVDPQENLSDSLKALTFKIDLASFVPNQWAKLIEDKMTLNRVFESCKGVLLGGAPLDVQLEKKSAELLFPIFHTYAMTETVSHIAYRQIKASNWETIYSVLPDIDIDRNVQNCLKIKSYLTGNQWIETNDIVEMINSSSFRLLGRNDFVINSAGFKIFPPKVERACQEFFEQYNRMVQLFVFGMKDAVYGQKMVIFSNCDLEAKYFDELKVFLLSQLDKKELPKEWIYVPEFQFTSNGKIDPIKTVNLYLNHSNNVNK